MRMANETQNEALIHENPQVAEAEDGSRRVFVGGAGVDDLGPAGVANNMKLLRYLASFFIDVFGITHPSIKAQDQAARYIGFLLLAMIVGLILMFVLAARVLGK